ncbi:PPE domain-containing protein [Mycobacterium bourgelatii]|uniref:PPE family protein n=1 Tax=Mycobacterium bourgelatii TaxID=1273442 RepID=A0A7I9YYT1_MYCBU|nr:PPE domain-containing protein [Mycobacterium bourgelatii]MCV6977421.1 PPE domain-containing protein [Mycobacterium bourgelatii]GFG93696.1 PPE family protein [Mycobacterium bourgelatii]
MPDPRWTGPPEVVAAIFEAGSPASVIANNVVWVTETANEELAEGLSEVNALATAAQWQGVGAVCSMLTATGLNAGLQTLVGWTAEKISVTQAAVEAFALARSSVIPSVISQTNRDEWAVLNGTNFFGQNTPAIVERDTEYFGEHWPHNSSVGWTYSAALSALTAALAVPPPPAPVGASPAAPAAAAQAVAQSAGQAGMHNAAQASTQAAQLAGQTTGPADTGARQLGSLMQEPLQMVSGVAEPFKQLGQAPMQAAQGFTGLPQGMMRAIGMGGMFPAGTGTPSVAGAGIAPVAGAGGASGGGGAGGGPGLPGAGLTSYTRPTSSFEPGGRPTSLRAGVLNAAELRGPTVSTGLGGAPMPMTPAGMLARGNGTESDKDAVTRARVVVAGDLTDPRR